mgnify:CR=1 FL=1
MKIKVFVNGRDYIADMVNEFAENIEVADIQTHLSSDQQIIAVIIYKEVPGDGR